MAQQLLQRLHTDVPLPVAKLSKCARRKRNLSQRRKAQLDESLESAQGRALVARRIGLCQQLAEHERVGRGQTAHLSRGPLRDQHMTAMNRALEPSVCCPPATS